MTKEEEQKIRDNMCNYYEPDRQSVIDLGKKKYPNTIMDLEEMKKEGLNYHFCPYYYPFYMEQYLDVFLMPYNYILDADLLPRFGNILSGSVVVFDEAHNVSEASCEGRSAELLKVNMTGAELELNKIFFNSKKSSKLA
jgi:Rad3-related DNA helicase